jgi:chaperonin GroEL
MAKDYNKDIVELVEFNNSNSGNRHVCLMKNTYRNDEYNAIMGDLYALTGSEITTNIDFDCIGTVSDVVVNEGYLVSKNTKENVLFRMHIDDLKASLEFTESPSAREAIEKRISRMEKGVATLHVGGDSDIEMKELRHRVDDAIKAIKSAIKHGVLPGGGYAILKSVSLFPKEYETHCSDLFFKGITAPFYKLLENSLHTPAESESIREKIVNENVVYNAKERQFESLDRTYIYDPYNVVVSSVINSVSIFLTILSTECVILEKSRNYED